MLSRYQEAAATLLRRETSVRNRSPQKLEKLATYPRYEHEVQFPYKLSGPPQDLAAALMAALALLVTNSRMQKGTHDLASCQQDSRIPLLAGLRAYGVMHYLLIPHVARGLSELTNDCIILEDASQFQRRVPMSHCEHFTLFEAFLQSTLSKQAR